jgi:ornithine cyclodeaminase
MSGEARAQPLLLLEDEIRDLLGPDEARRAVRDAFAGLARGEATLPAVVDLEIPQYKGEVHVKSAFLHATPYYTIKVASGFYDNRERGLPVGNGLMMVFEADTGSLAALLLDNGFLTDLRTGAAGAVAADLLARRDIDRVAVIGAGIQGRFQLEALLRVRTPRSVAVYDLSEPARTAYAEEMSARTGLPVEAVASAEAAVRGADIVITVTPSREPYLRSEWLSPGMHVTAVGSDMPQKGELYPDVLVRADTVVVDSLRQCLGNGEVHHAVEAGLMKPGDVTAELGAIAAGMRPGRQRDDEITVADLTGVGVQDAAVAAATVAAARARGVGRLLV